jgi:hypothetical protein
MNRQAVRPTCFVFSLFFILLVVPQRASAQVLSGPVQRLFITCSNSETCITFDRPRNQINGASPDVAPQSALPWNFGVTGAIVSSKIMFSGTVLRTLTNDDCTQYEWFVVTQARESSSVLIYNPVDIGSEYCDYETPGQPAANETDRRWVYLPLPVHIIWAEVIGYHINRGDSFHKAPAALPTSTDRNCANVAPLRPGAPPLPTASTVLPDALKLCDQQDWSVRWFYKTGAVYNRLIQPGTGQGAISYTPVIGSGTQSLSYDVQITPSTRLGPGWIGTPFVFEKSGSQNANLDSLTGALSYEIHPEKGGNILPYRGGRAPIKWSPVVLRDVQFQVKSGVEYAPTTPHDLNTVQSELLKMPVVFTIRKQPSAFTLYPLFGLEQVHHVATHLSGYTASQYRQLAGGDASLRWPFGAFRNLLGDKPITIDFSYRYRWLSNPEPTTNYQKVVAGTAPQEFLSAESHSYTRATYNAPLSSYLAFKVTVQHGALPPDFRSLGYTLQLGLSFSDPGSTEH